jgi:alkyl sulfatase BDS1-like metallo-beta-lactamase superfamily hydrolase
VQKSYCKFKMGQTMLLRYLLFASVSLLSACSEDRVSEQQQAAPVTGLAALEQHSAIFTPRVENPAAGVYVAIGYALANSILIEGEGGAIVVDTTESRGAAEAVLRAFREVSDAPIRAIIYTHNHADHIMGASVFTDGKPIPIYAHAALPEKVSKVVNVLQSTVETNAMRMFGEQLAAGGERVINDGIGPELRQIGASDGLGAVGYVPPTHLVSDELSVTIAGVNLVLLHAPGETDDQLVVWLPDQRVLLAADNIYKAFPNLYTIRGTSYRDVRQWSDTLRMMASLRAEVLVPSHTIPLYGEAEITALLSDYADAIQFVHDQTVRLINLGVKPTDIARELTLPDELAQHEWLQPFYGTVAWSARSVYSGYLGWFDGDSVDLFPTSESEKSARLVRLMGGSESALGEGEAMLQSDPQWALELSELVLNSDRDNLRAQSLKGSALRLLAQNAMNPNARNWYLSEALELEGKVQFKPRAIDAERLAYAQDLPVEGLLDRLQVSLDPDKSRGIEQQLQFVFPDQNKRFLLTVRHQVLIIEPIDSSIVDVTEITVNASDWLALVAQHDSFPAAIASGRLKVSSGISDLPAVLSFLGLFSQ